MNLTAQIRQRGQGLILGWRAFWFRSEAAYTLGVVRIAFGALVVGWTLLLSSDLYLAFGSEGVLPRAPSRAFTWSVFSIYTSDSALLVGWIVLLCAAFALMVGWHSRLAAILVFILILSFERRNPLIFNSGDTVIRIEALFLALAPCGAALSLDQRRRGGSFWSAREIRPWPIRLLQIQLSIIYLSTVVAKLAGETWQNGTAVAYSLRQRDLLIVPAPSWVTDSLLISNALTWGTLVIEAALGILVWNRRWCLRVLAAGVILHLSISLSMEVGFFSCAMFVLYLAFIPPERAQAIAHGLEKRISGLVSRFRREDVPGDPADEANDVLRSSDGTDSAGRRAHSGDHVDDDAPRRRVPEPAVTLSRRRVPPEISRINGHARVPNGAWPERPADALPNGRPRPAAVPLTTPVQVVDRANGDQPSGRHARPAGHDPVKGFHWPDDVRTRLTD
jgi:hypothetical protein